MSIHNEALFISDKSPENHVRCLIYVDDILMTSPSPQVLSETVETLKENSTLTSIETLHRVQKSMLKTKGQILAEFRRKTSVHTTPTFRTWRYEASHNYERI